MDPFGHPFFHQGLYFQEGFPVDNAVGGLRLLARMIARRLVGRKTGAYGQHPHPGLPAGGVDEQADLGNIANWIYRRDYRYSLSGLLGASNA